MKTTRKVSRKRIMYISIAAGLVIGACGVTSPTQPEIPAAPTQVVLPADGGGETTTPAQSDPAQATTAPDTGTSSSGANCYGEEIHPIGQSISDVYEVSYDQVMTWFCDGYPFEDILQAAISSELSGVPVDDLFAMLDSGKSWDDIWDELGILNN